MDWLDWVLLGLADGGCHKAPLWFNVAIVLLALGIIWACGGFG